MKVVIFCGGLGTRLKEETEFKPKPMINIGHRPILWHIMKNYAYYGHKDFILTLGYKGEMIKNYFFHYEIMNNDVTIELGKPAFTQIHQINPQHGENGWRITLADTGEKALKGARLKKLQKFIPDETFLATYGDGLANVNIPKLVAFHNQHGKLATLTGVNPTPASRFGELMIDGDLVESFREKPIKTTGGLVNGGFFVLNRAIFDYLTTDDECDLEIGALEQIAKEGQLMVYRHEGFWACMDTLRDMDYLNKLWDEDLAEWKVW